MRFRREPGVPRVRSNEPRSPSKEHAMISRLTASAALFAILATAGLGFAAEAQQRPAAKQAAAAASMPTVTLPMVVVTGKRLTRS
jgi:hypothetical protein